MTLATVSPPILSVEGLVKEYSAAAGVRALDGVSFQVRAGEFVAVLGKSGSGKSTLLRCINRLVEPSAGRIVFQGAEVTRAGVGELRRLRRKIGMIFQDYNLVRRADALTNVLTGRLGYTPAWRGLFNRFDAQAEEEAYGHLQRLGLAEKTFARADTLSGGQQQRVGIARALMQEPALLLADEPVSSLDPGAARNIMDILRQINAGGVTVLCNLHRPDLACEYAGRVLALRAGCVVYDGPASDFDAQQLLA
jgi:phosphonate transport system ATP-binding protein